MAAKKATKDLLTRALAEAPVARKKTSQGEVTEQITPRAQPVSQVLEALQAQAKEAMAGSFFDEGATAKSTPVTKRARSEAGTVEISAKRRDPSVKASVAIDVRCDRDEESDAGRYQVRAQGHLGRESEAGVVEADVSVPVSVERDADGGLKLDSEQMRTGMADAIRSTGTPRSRKPHC
jgi:hypothetical protein